MTMVTTLIDWVAQQPALLDFIRRVLEYGHRGEKEVIVRELPARQAQNVLDLGCGTGVFSPWFGPGYAGIDIDERYVAYARRRYPDMTFTVMDAGALRFPNYSFDAVWVNGVLHHLDDEMVRQVVREMRRVLKPGGRAVVMEDVPAIKMISRFIRSLDVGEYIRTPEAYRRLLAERFTVQAEYPLRTGVCDYQVFILV